MLAGKYTSPDKEKTTEYERHRQDQWYHSEFILETAIGAPQRRYDATLHKITTITRITQRVNTRSARVHGEIRCVRRAVAVQLRFLGLFFFSNAPPRLVVVPFVPSICSNFRNKRAYHEMKIFLKSKIHLLHVQ